MPKPFSHLTGNGAHFHMSLADVHTNKNVFHDASDPLGLSQIGRWFMGGVLHHAEALAAITAPLVNSYKRLVRGAPRSGDVGARLCDLWQGESYADDPHTGCWKNREPHRGWRG